MHVKRLLTVGNHLVVYKNYSCRCMGMIFYTLTFTHVSFFSRGFTNQNIKYDSQRSNLVHIYILTGFEFSSATQIRHRKTSMMIIFVGLSWYTAKARLLYDDALLFLMYLFFSLPLRTKRLMQ